MTEPSASAAGTPRQLLVNIDVDDLAAGTAFYRAAFGLAVGRRFGAGGVELLGLPAPLYLLAKPVGSAPFDADAADAADGPTGSRPEGDAAAGSAAHDHTRRYERHWTPVHLDFVVDDIDAALQQALVAGARIERGPSTAPWGRLVMLADPFGHGICLLQFTGRGYDEIADAG